MTEPSAATTHVSDVLGDRPVDRSRLTRASGIRSIQVGELRITYVPDGAVQLKPRGWLPTATDEEWAAHQDYVDDSGYLVASIGGLLVEHGERAILIDAGYGPRASPADRDHPLIGAIHGGALLDNLAQIGREPDEIEAVAFTHLHPDHTGWAWQPAPADQRTAFTKADLLIAESEWSHHHDAAHFGVTDEAMAALIPRVRTIIHDQEIFPGVRVFLTPGHTPGHTAYTINSGGKKLIAFGDAFHSPIQIDHPDWVAAPDTDRAQAIRSRRQLLAELQDPDTIGFGVHFADVVFGQVRGYGPAWRPEP